MFKAPTAKSRKRSEDAILDQAVQQLLNTIKIEATEDGRSVEREQLRKDGYSERFIEKVKKPEALGVVSEAHELLDLGEH